RRARAVDTEPRARRATRDAGGVRIDRGREHLGCYQRWSDRGVVEGRAYRARPRKLRAGIVARTSGICRHHRVAVRLDVPTPAERASEVDVRASDHKIRTAE